MNIAIVLGHLDCSTYTSEGTSDVSEKHTFWNFIRI